MVIGVDEISLLHVWLTALEDGPEKSEAEMQRIELATAALFRIPQAYDQAFGTDWEDELHEMFDTYLEEGTFPFGDDEEGGNEPSSPAPN